jgi:PAS domain S-box-containing protein
LEFYAEQIKNNVLDSKVDFRATRKGGTDLWVEQNTRIIRDTNGKVKQFRIVVRDITERKQNEEMLRKAESRTQRQRLAIAKLAVNESISKGDIDSAKRILTEIVSNVIQVERSSVWLFSEDSKTLDCIELFEASTGKHSQGSVLKADDYPLYFEAIHNESRIATYDARTDRRTSEFTQNYMLPLNITSMLDVGIILEGKLVGVMCLEHTGEKRQWFSDEESFASTIASLIVQVIVNESRRRAEEALQNERLLLRTLIDNIPDSIYSKDLACRKTLANLTDISYAGVKSEAEILGKTDFDFYPKELADGFFTNDQSVMQSGEPVLNKEEYIIDVNGHQKWLLTSKLPLKDEKGNIIGIVGIGRDITERKRWEVDIKNRNEQLSKLIVEKDKFFSIIAHDLKSPLQGLLGLSEILAIGDEDFTKAELTEYGKFFHEAASNLFKLIENLLEWAQMQRGSIKFTPLELNLIVVTLRNIETIKYRASQKGITIINEILITEKVYADEKMIDTIFRNLLSNAVKFTRRDGKVIIRAKKIDSKLLEISVRDTGVGMSEEKVKKLFKIDEMVSSKGTEGEPSTGLGLLLCKEFVEKHGGRIWVDSEKGRGSTFSFSLPVEEQLTIG